MKNIFVLLLLSLSIEAKASVTVSVLSFKNKVGNVSCNQDWYWWNDHLGTAFQDMLQTELSKNSQIELLERENIQEINDLEVGLINSEKSHHKIAKGHFTKAKFTVMGAVTGYEYCADKKKIGVGVSAVAGFLGLGGAAGQVADTVSNVGVAKAHAKVIIDLRVVETETGRIVKTVKAEGTAQRSNFKIESSLASFEDASETPVGEASRQAIEKAVKDLQPTLLKASAVAGR